MKHVLLFIFVIIYVPFSGYSQINNYEKIFNDDLKSNKFKKNLLNATAPTLKLDSIFNDNQWKQIFEYNNQGNIISEIKYYWEAGSWNGENKFEYIYDVNQYLIQMNYFENNNGWKNRSKEEYTNNPTGLKKEKISYNWDAVKAEWVINQKIEYEYDNLSNMTRLIYYSQNENEWISTAKASYEYNLAGNILEYVFYLKANDEYKEFLKDEYTYNTNNKILEEKSYEMVEGVLSEKKRIVYDYYEDGGKKEAIGYVKQQDSDDLIYSYRHIFVNDSELNIIQRNNFKWDSQNGDWIETYKYSATYDNTYALSDLIVPKWFSDQYTGMITNENGYLWDGENNDWMLSYDDYFYYSQFIVSGLENDIVGNMVKIYPNPTTDNINIEIDNNSGEPIFRVYNIQGKEMFSKTINGNCTISVEHFPTGIYFYNINLNNINKSGRIIKN